MTEAVRVLAECPLAVASPMGMADMETGRCPRWSTRSAQLLGAGEDEDEGGSGSRELEGTVRP
jgi:hypothetical protein